MGEYEVTEELRKHIALMIDSAFCQKLSPGDAVLQASHNIAKHIVAREKGLNKIIAALVFQQDKITVVPIGLKQADMYIPTGVLAKMAPEAVTAGDGGHTVVVSVRQY